MKLDKTTTILILCLVAILITVWLSNSKKVGATNVFVFLPHSLGETQITTTISGHGNVVGGMNTVRNMIDATPSLN